MARCVNISPVKRKLCAGAFNAEITIQDRTLDPSDYVDASHVIDFDNDVTVRAAIATLGPGVVVFDGSNDRQASHDFFINYVDKSNVTAENWILYNNRRFDILDVENLEERNRFIRLRCNERGTTSNAVNSQ